MGRFFVIALTVLLGISAQAQKRATVLRVIDGDTFVAKLYQSKDTVIVRVLNIDTPERKSAVTSKTQPFADEASKEANNVLLGKDVKLYYTGLQSYGREVARVKVDGYYFDRYMVSNGFAWSLSKSKLFFRLEKRAKDKEMGLWALSDAIKPEVWRATYSTRK